MISTSNPHEVGEHFGKALRYLIEDNPHPTMININKLTDLATGFFNKIGETCQDQGCIKSLSEVPSSIGLVGMSINNIVIGKEGLNGFAMKLVLVFLDLKKVNSSCELGDLKSKILKLLTPEGLTQATIRYGMNIKKINSKKADLAKAFSNDDFKLAGSIYADLFKIMLSWKLI